MHNKTQKIENFIIDVLVISLGLIISSFGIALFYQADMGSGAMATFCDGIHNMLGISYGTANMLANIVFLVLLIFCDRRMINVGTILCVSLIGVFVDVGNMLFGMLPIASAAVPVRFICMLLGCAMMGIGLALYVAVDRGFGALEGMVKYLCAKTGFSFAKVKIAQDFILILLGIALQARWGIGTLISAFTIGPIMKVFISLFQKLLKRDKNIIK